LKRKLAAIGAGGALVVAVLAGAHGKSPASPSSGPATSSPAPAQRAATPATPVIVPSPAPSPSPAVFVVPTPTVVPAASPSVTVRPSSAPKTTAAPPASAPAPASCGGDYYRNVDGDCIHRPVSSSTAPAGATAECRDGSYSFSQHHQGTCSGHGGVAEWL
jgi:hypothetical protein